MNALHSACFQNSVIRGSIWDSQWGDDHTHPNAPLFGEVEWYLTCQQVAHAGDTFNTYCQCMLAEILDADASVWPLFPAKLFGKDKFATIQKLKKQGKNDGAVREALRDYVESFWCNEIEIIATLRNKIVHQAGVDHDGDVAATIAEFPHGEMTIYPAALDPNDFPVDVSAEGKLMIDAKTGYWASQHVLNLVHLMDQHLCTRFNLERSLKPIRKQSFKGVGGSVSRVLSPGTPLPQPLTNARPLLLQPLTPLKPISYEPMSNPKEQACAQIWQRVISEIHDFIDTTCEEVGVEATEVSNNIAGNIQSHTLAGHDHNLGYKLRAMNALGDSVNELGVRLRQKDFAPYITIWSTKTQMLDYHPCELSDAVKAHLIKSIQQTISS
jgi:hypothetical protein